LTAKHSIVESEPYDAVGVWVAYDSRYNPTSPAIPIAAYALHSTLDIAVFVLASSPGGAVGMADAPVQQGAQLTIAGYAMPYADESVRYSSGSGVLTSANPTALTYYINTSTGDSGAPVFCISDGVATAVAVHTEASNNPSLGNSGVALSAAVRADIAELVAFARSNVR
jgi:V8-like Glu-specific endopeptidase